VSGLLFDAGALIALDRGDGRLLALMQQAHRAKVPLATTAPVIAQAWRDGGRQARLGTFIKLPDVTTHEFTRADARAVGELVRLSGHPDVVDVHVVMIAGKYRYTVLTSDHDDLHRVDPRVPLVSV
jgi:hypothetical protein